MIPSKLAVRNFMPYRENVPPLSFDGIHTACICGDNGNGKSALIDAVTWALWGKTRAKNDDDLIHQGQTETEVEFEFRVGEQLYRIIRKHAKPKRQGQSGQSSLDLFIASNGDFKVISGDRMSQTQQKIIDILHMDYDTFINSAFLRQGHADEFTMANPAKRKEVLTTILGLSFYDELEERAKELAKQRELEKEQLESTIKEIDEELRQKPAYEAEFAQAQSELARVEGVLKEREGRLNELRREKEKLENKKQQLDQLERHIKEDERSLARWSDQVKQHQSRLKEYEDLLARRADIETGYAQLNEAKRLNEELYQKSRVVRQLESDKHKLENIVNQAGQELLREHALAQRDIEELGKKTQKLPQLKNELQQLQTQSSQLAGREEALRQKKQANQELRAKVNYSESNLKQLVGDIGELEEKLRLLLHQEDTKCPLCETDVGAEGLKLIEEKYTADRQNKNELLQSTQADLGRKKTALEISEKEATQLEAKLNEDRGKIQGRLSVINQSMTEAEEANRKLAEERVRLAEIEERLARHVYAASEQEALGKIESELATIEYNPQQHEEVRLRLTNLEKYEGLRQKLEEVDKLIIQEKEALSQAEEAIKELDQTLQGENTRKQDLSAELTLLPQVASSLMQAENEHQALVAQQKQAQGSLFSARAKLQRCDELETKRREKEKLLAEAAREEQIYQELAQAFGKKGIQALLIEMALPEIETEANKLLSRMTDNRMHVKFETQRPTRKGEVAETLDIKISDELGTRNYEMFSGGEAFRINFAIRIALSKLLAKRAGAPLPTLIVDEGFGTQDNVGVEKLKEAINSIQDDFQKILIITHLEEMKDAFPSRIEVIKTAAGSTIEVS
jgi:exonuclease SbcC